MAEMKQPEKAKTKPKRITAKGGKRERTIAELAMEATLERENGTSRSR